MDLTTQESNPMTSESNDEYKILDVYCGSCGSTISEVSLVDECEWTDGSKSSGVEISDNGDKTSTSWIQACHMEPSSLQDAIDKERSSLPDRIVDHCSLDKTQREVVKVEIPLVIAERAVTLIDLGASKGCLFDSGLKQSVSLVMDLIFEEVAWYELLKGAWETLEDFSMTNIGHLWMIKVEIPLEIAKDVVNICYSDPSKVFLLHGSLKQPVFLVMDLIRDEVAKYKRDGMDKYKREWNERSTLQNSSRTTKTRRREVVKIRISLEMAKCVVNIYESKSCIWALEDCSLLKPVILVMEVILDAVTKKNYHEMVEIEIPLIISKCAVNAFSSEITKPILLEYGLNMSMSKVMHLIQKAVTKCMLPDDVSLDHPKSPTSEENLCDFYIEAEDCEAEGCEVEGCEAEGCKADLRKRFLQNMDPTNISDRRLKKLIQIQEWINFICIILSISFILLILIGLVVQVFAALYLKNSSEDTDCLLSMLMSWYFGFNETDVDELAPSMAKDVQEGLSESVKI